MPSVASSGPKAHPNAHLAGLMPSPPVKTTNTIWQPSELVPGSYHAFGGDRKHRMSSALTFNLNHAIGLLKRSNCGIRDLIRQHESAWIALRLLYNHVVILQKLLERLRDMLENVAHVESVARDVNIYEPHLGVNDKDMPKDIPKDMPKDRSKGKTEGRTEEKTKDIETGKAKATKHAVSSFPLAVNRNAARTQKSPLAWSRRVLPRVEDMMLELRNYLANMEEACVWTVRRQSSRFLPDPDAIPLRWNDNYIYATVRRLSAFEQNIEVHMTTCKYINMISTDALYKDRTGMRLDDSDTCYFLDDGSSRHDRAAFFTFWSSVSLAEAAKRHRGKDKKKTQQRHEKHTNKVKGKETGNDKGQGKSKQRIEASKDCTESPAGKEDLVAAIGRKDYLTVVTLLMSDMSLNDMLEDGTFVLSHAVDDDNSALVSMLAICGADPNVRHRSGNTPLHFASNTDCIASALVLLEIGAKVDVRGAHGLTPLHIACRERHLSIVLHLLAHGADPNVCDNRGVTPLGYALMHPKWPTLSRDVVTTLLTYGARATGRNLVLSPFIESILRYDSALMGRYLRTTPDVVDAEMSVATAGPDGGIVRLRPLYAALLVGNIFAIDLLLRRGADIHHVTTVFGKTTPYLDLAVQSDSTAIVSRLLLANADPNVAAANGRTPLHLAASAAHCEIEVVTLLLRHGADVHARTTRHSQALHVAVRAGRADICFHLLKKGAQVNSPLSSGVTPVMLAVYYNNRSMLRFLMSNGGDVRYKTPLYGETAMHTASRVGNVALAMLLLQHGLSVNAVNPFQSEAGTEDDGADRNDDDDDDSGDDSDVTNKGTAKIKGKDMGNDMDKAKTTSPSKRSRSRSGYAPIHAAASRGHLGMVHWLLANGADPTARIGRIAARVCLGDDGEVKRQAGRKEREGEVVSGRSLVHTKYDMGDDAADRGRKDGVDIAAGAATDNTADHNAASPLDAASDDDEDLGATPVEIARAFGHERTAGVIEDAILAASPQCKEFLSTRRSSTSSLSSEDARTESRSPPPRSRPPSQNSFEPEYDSADEDDALAGELGKGKEKVQTPAPPPHGIPAGDGSEHDDESDVADQEPASSAW